VAALALFGPRAAGPAWGQCLYPTLIDDTPQVFATTPQFTRFTQTAGRWAAVAVQSGGSANWDVGISLSSAAFPTCVTLPVVASQQPSGIDFVLGDFAAEGTGLHYAPIARAGGSGSATVEWDSGSRTAVVGSGANSGPTTPQLIDCWNVDLEAGTSYRIALAAEAGGDYRLYAFRRGASSSWRSRADALVEIISNFASPPILTAPATDRYALVVVRETATTQPYLFTIQACVDPPHLEPHVSLPVPPAHPFLLSAFQFEPAGNALPTLAMRTAQAGDGYALIVSRHVDPGFYPCEGVTQVTSVFSGQRVELLVGDQVTGAVPPGGSWWLGALRATNLEGRAEYSPGTDLIAVDGATQYVVGGPDLVVRTFRADLVAGTDYRVHVAKCGPATGRLYIFRPFDAAFPAGNGWSGLTGDHAPLAALTVTGVNDFTFTPSVTGAYAVVLTNETAENNCWELGLSTCRPRSELEDRIPVILVSDPPLPYDGEVFGTRHFRGGWSAVAARPLAAGEDWVVEAWDTPTGGAGAPPFGCLQGLLGASTEDGAASPTDFLARYDPGSGDLRENVETVRVYPATHDSPGGGAHVLYEQWNVILSVGDPVNQHFTSPADLIEVVNIPLAAGQTYSFLFDPEGFAGELFLFRPVAACAGDCPQEYAHPGSAGMEFRTTGSRVFTATETAMYGMVIVNQDGGSGRFWLAVSPATVDAGPPPGPARTTRFRGATPNPLGAAGGAARLEFELARPARVGFEIVNLAGRVVARIAEAPFAAGRGATAWSPLGADGRRLVPGLYFARMRVDGAVVSAAAKLTVLAGD
jgi:hypothetical protein